MLMRMLTRAACMKLCMGMCCMHTTVWACAACTRNVGTCRMHTQLGLCAACTQNWGECAACLRNWGHVQHAHENVSMCRMHT